MSSQEQFFIQGGLEPFLIRFFLHLGNRVQIVFSALTGINLSFCLGPSPASLFLLLLKRHTVSHGKQRCLYFLIGITEGKGSFLQRYTHILSHAVFHMQFGKTQRKLNFALLFFVSVHYMLRVFSISSSCSRKLPHSYATDISSCLNKSYLG